MKNQKLKQTSLDWLLCQNAFLESSACNFFAPVSDSNSSSINLEYLEKFYLIKFILTHLVRFLTPWSDNTL